MRQLIALCGLLPRVRNHNRLVQGRRVNHCASHSCPGWRVAWDAWHHITWPFPGRPSTVSNCSRHLVDIRRPGQLSSLFNRLSLAIRRRELDRPRNGLVQVIVPNAVWIGLSWIIWQPVSVRLWIIWRNCRVLMVNCDGYINVTIGIKGQLAWHFIAGNCPPGWRFVWHLHRPIGLTRDRGCVDGVAVTIHVVDVGRVLTARVGHINRLVRCGTIDDLLGDLFYTWHIASDRRHCITIPFRC